jgi:hypothetical protein
MPFLQSQTGRLNVLPAFWSQTTNPHCVKTKTNTWTRMIRPNAFPLAGSHRTSLFLVVWQPSEGSKFTRRCAQSVTSQDFVLQLTLVGLQDNNFSFCPYYLVIQWGQASLSQRVKPPRPKPDNSPPLRASVTNKWKCTSSPSNAFMTCAENLLLLYMTLIFDFRCDSNLYFTDFLWNLNWACVSTCNLEKPIISRLGLKSMQDAMLHV